MGMDLLEDNVRTQTTSKEPILLVRNESAARGPSVNQAENQRFVFGQ